MKVSKAATIRISCRNAPPKKIRDNHICPSSIGSAKISAIVNLIKLPPMRVFPISYAAAKVMVLRAGKPVGIHLRPHDLRRHSAIYAVQSGVPMSSPIT